MAKTRKPPFIKPKKRVFITAEGSWEQAFAKWLQLLCDQHDLKLHLDIANAGGGDPLAIVECAINKRKRGKRKGPYIASMVILDDDRLNQDIDRGDRAIRLAQENKLPLIFQHPNFEGQMLQLHLGCETRRPSADRALAELKRVWPEYDKRKVIGVDFSRRFTIEDLRRAANHNNDLKLLLELLRLF